MTRQLLGCLLAFLINAACAASDDDAFLLVLGVAQDGGYPQTNCFRPDCLRAWRDFNQRHQVSSVAVVDPEQRRAYLFDATPDLPSQMFRLHEAAPDFALDGVFLTHAHIGHYTGLMHFGHEATGASDLPVYAMPRMTEFLRSNGPWDQLVRFGNIELRPLANGQTVKLDDELRVIPFEVPHRDEYSETVGYRIDGPNKSAVFIPDIDKWSAWDQDIVEVVRSVDYALLDATFYADGELPNRDMSQVRHPFVTESIALFESLDEEERARVIFIHMNHTNPLLDEGSAASKAVRAAGFRVATEGLRLPL